MIRIAVMVMLAACSTDPHAPWHPDAPNRCPKRDAAGAERVQYCPYIDASPSDAVLEARDP